MTAIEDKTAQYESLLAEALTAAEIAPPPTSPLGEVATTFEEMAQAYHSDGRHFEAENELGDALAAYAYGHAWLDAGARLGLFEVPREDDLFTV